MIKQIGLKFIILYSIIYDLKKNEAFRRSLRITQIGIRKPCMVVGLHCTNVVDGACPPGHGKLAGGRGSLLLRL